MSKNKFEDTFNIFLFPETREEENFSSKLSEFLAFLKYNKVHLPYKFSYVSRGTDALIPELTLNENILMDFTPDSLTASKQFQFQEFLSDNPNRHLEKLYQEITLPHELPGNSDSQMKKLSGLIKSLIFEGQFIFLEEPEIHLEAETVKQFINALKEHIARNKQNVFIYSRNPELWMPHVNIIVNREKDYTFSTQKITLFNAPPVQRKIVYKKRKVTLIENNPFIYKFANPMIQKMPLSKSAA